MLQNKPLLFPSYPTSPRLGDNLSPSSNFPKDLSKSITKKNPSLPNFPSKAVFPANVINIFPKSRRKSTLKIFKVKIKEDKEFEKLVLENGQTKRNAYMHEIKRKDEKTAVEALVEKSKVDYQKKKKQNNIGSMYINDLWGKRYEVNVRRQARIDAEIKKEEDFKRKPMQVKLKEAERLFEKKFNTTKSQSQPQHLIPEKLNQPGPIFTERNVKYETESSLIPGKTLLTEPRDEYQSYNEEMLTSNHKPRLLPEVSCKSSNTQNDSIATSMTMMFDGMPKSARDHTLPDSFSRIPEKSKFGEARQLATEAYFPEDKLLLSSKGGSKKSNFMPSLSPRGGFELSKRKTIMEKQLALGDILDKCQFEMEEGQGWAGKLQELRTVFTQRNIEKKKRAAHLKKEQEIEMYKDSFEKVSNRKKLEM